MAGEPSRTRKTLLWLGMGIPGVIAFCATVPAEQARSNLASWFQLIGIDRIPLSLQTAAADRWALAAAIVSLLGPLYAWPRESKRQRAQIAAAEEAVAFAEAAAVEAARSAMGARDIAGARPAGGRSLFRRDSGTGRLLD